MGSGTNSANAAPTNANNASQEPQQGPLTVRDVDVDLVPVIYDIIKTIERESQESTQAKRSEFNDTSQKLVDFKKKLDSLKDQIKKLPGISYSKEEQLKKLEALRKQLVLKKQLLQKYKDMCALEGVKEYLTPGNPSS